MRLTPLPVLAAVIALSGCGRAVTVQPAAQAPGAGGECAELSAALPDQLAGQPRIDTQPDPATTAAWGAPAVVWRCGVPMPQHLQKTSQLISVNGVDWFPEPLSDGTRFTTVGVAPAREVTVPAAYPNPAGVLAELPDVSASPDPGAAPR